MYQRQHISCWLPWQIDFPLGDFWLGDWGDQPVRTKHEFSLNLKLKPLHFMRHSNTSALFETCWMCYLLTLALWVVRELKKKWTNHWQTSLWCFPDHIYISCEGLDRHLNLHTILSKNDIVTPVDLCHIISQIFPQMHHLELKIKTNPINMKK